jgi:transposase
MAVCVRLRTSELSGRSFYLLMPSVSIPAFTIALQHFADFISLDHSRQVLLLLDNAGWHSSPKVICPPQLELRFLPAYSPELQPAEHLWQLTDKPLVNRWFDCLDDLEQTLADHCRWLQQQFDIVRSTTQFNWWPAYV